MKAYEIVSKVLIEAEHSTRVGVSLLDINRLAEEIIYSEGGVSINKGYEPKPDWPEDKRPKKPFPTALVANVNGVIAHGEPTEYKLCAGDIVAYDVGVKKDGWCGDAALTVLVPPVENKNERLVRYAKKALYAGIKVVRAGVNSNAIGDAIEKYAMRMGYVVNYTFVGHHIGEEMHMEPLIPHYMPRDDDKGHILKVGDQICLEPMLTFKDRVGYRLTDWAWATRDGSYSAVFEHQLEVTEEGCKILTNHISEF